MARGMAVNADDEIRSLRTVLRDLVALSAIPAAWVGLEPAAVGQGTTLHVTLPIEASWPGGDVRTPVSR